MNVLVTGGAGYIGSHAVRRLLQDGHTVVVVDDLSLGHRAAVDGRAKFVHADVRDGATMTALLRDAKIDAVVHFAAVSEVGGSVKDPGKYYDNNVRGGLALFDAMRAAGVTKIVFSSTAAVYGAPDVESIPETYPKVPINPYGRTKLMLETILEDYATAHGLAPVALRYFNVAGASPDGTIGEAHEPETHLIPRLLQVAAGRVPHATIFGTDYDTPDGTCIRDYVHVDDIAGAHALAMTRCQAGRFEVFNLGSARGFSVREVLAACRRVTGAEIPAHEEPRRVGDPARLVAGSGKIRSELGWQLAYADLDTIVVHAWQWHRTHPRGYG